MRNIPKVSVVIPLFRSGRFIDNIIDNIALLPTDDIEILISDRHCYDDTIDRLQNHFADDPRVRCLKHHDELDWIGNINSLLEQARGEYWQFLPHDDIVFPGSLESLISGLDSNPDAILAYGPIKPVDINGCSPSDSKWPMPHPAEAKDGWTLGLVLPMFWKWYFNGAFKGLIRRNIIMQKDLLIRSTRGQIYPERCWLFALCLVGCFHYVPQARYLKRMYKDSLHASWDIQGANYFDVARVMSGYLRDLACSESVYCYAKRDLWLNAARMARWQDCKIGAKPQYIAAPAVDRTRLRNISLPFK